MSADKVLVKGAHDFCSSEVRVSEPGENLMSVKESGTELESLFTMVE